MPFLNDRKLITYPEKDIVTLDDMEVPLVKDHDEPPCISTISRSRSKAESHLPDLDNGYKVVIEVPEDKAPIGAILTQVSHRESGGLIDPGHYDYNAPRGWQSIRMRNSGD